MRTAGTPAVSSRGTVKFVLLFVEGIGMRLTPADLAAALPDLTSTVHAPGLQQPVEIARDRWGIPHIRAATEHDAFFAQGFVNGPGSDSGTWTTTATGHSDARRNSWAARASAKTRSCARSASNVRQRRTSKCPATALGRCSVPMLPASTPSSRPARRCPLNTTSSASAQSLGRLGTASPSTRCATC